MHVTGKYDQVTSMQMLSVTLEGLLGITRERARLGMVCCKCEVVVGAGRGG